MDLLQNQNYLKTMKTLDGMPERMREDVFNALPADIGKPLREMHGWWRLFNNQDLYNAVRDAVMTKVCDDLLPNQLHPPRRLRGQKGHIMKDISGKQWEYCNGEKYALKWFEEHGFDVIIQKRYISKDKLTVSKDGVSMPYEIPLGDNRIDYPAVMRLFEKDFDLYVKLDALQAEATARDILV